MINKLAAVCLTGVIGFLTSCKDQELPAVLGFPVSFDTVATVPKAKFGAIQDTAFQMVFNVKQQTGITARGLKPELIKDVQVDSAKMVFQKPEGFQWLDSAALTFDAESLDEEWVARKANFPQDSSQTVSLNTAQTNMAPYIQQNTFQIRLTTKHRITTRASKAVFLQLFFTFRYEEQ